MKRLVTVAFASIILALACGEEVTTEEDYRVIPASPVYVLKNVMVAFNRGDINLLKAMLSENFTFYFDPDDVGQHPPGVPNYVIPESWTYTEFWQVLQRMFTRAYSIDLTIPTAGVGEPGPSATDYRAENINLTLLVYIDELNGFIVNHGYCNFEFERYDGAEGQKFWRLTKWWDRTGHGYDAGPGVSPSTLGKILAVYR